RDLGSLGFFDRREHCRQPGVSCACVDREGRVPHAKARRTLLGAVRSRSAPVLAEEEGECSLAGLEVRGIQRTEDAVGLDPHVEPLDERVEERLTTDDLEHGRGFIRHVTWLPRCAVPGLRCAGAGSIACLLVRQSWLSPSAETRPADAKGMGVFATED